MPAPESSGWSEDRQPNGLPPVERGIRLLHEFERHGYAVLRSVIDPARLQALRRQADRIAAQWRAECGGSTGRLVNMHSLTHERYFLHDRAARAAFFDALLPEALTAQCDGCFGGGLYFHNTQLFFDPVDTDMQPYWHRDLQFSAVSDDAQREEQGRLLSLHLRMPLVAELGLELIPGSHRRWDTALEAKVRHGRDGYAVSEVLPGSVLLALEPGDVAVFDAQMIHRGHYRAGKERKALDLCVGKPHRFTLPFLDRAVLPERHEMASIRNRAWLEHSRRLVRESEPPLAQAD